MMRSVKSFSPALYQKCLRTFCTLGSTDLLVNRHLGATSKSDLDKMLKTVGKGSLEEFVNSIIPNTIRDQYKKLSIGAPKGEQTTLNELKTIMSQNQVFRSHIGCGYFGCITPPVILRNILENPAWYTSYTPYQGEISQGRLEMLLNFQTMVADLTALPMANASLLDEGTAAAEAIYMCRNLADSKRNTFLIADNCHPQTIAVCKTRAPAWGVNVKVMPHAEFSFDSNVFGCMVQYPATDGRVDTFADMTNRAHAAGVKVAVATDLLALCLLTPPGEWGADIAFGGSQRFGIPMGFGGPSAAFFATRDEHKRKMPGRVIGVSKDARGKPALRMAMQTREQHIRREKATSNICTAQALLANMAAAYAIYHGPCGLKKIATKVHAAAKTFASGCKSLGLNTTDVFFDTVRVEFDSGADKVVEACQNRRINIRKLTDSAVSVTFDETVESSHIDELLTCFSKASGVTATVSPADDLVKTVDLTLPAPLARQSAYLTHEVFNTYFTETHMLRYLYSLQMRDLSLATAMIPLGSCTMKLNATSEMMPLSWPEVANMHPFAPVEQTKGYQKVIGDLKRWLCNITGFAECSLQPNSGAQGEFTGLKVIQAYHASRGDSKRNVCLIPSSAHGTNPASSVVAGFEVIVTACDSKGNVDIKDLKAKAEKYKDRLACLMITYPSTHGVFEEDITEIISVVHSYGGQVYMDGANMNAQVGFTSPSAMGADVCHLNLHKTFAVPHGGGGPGMGPICVARHLAQFLPSHPVVQISESESAIGPVSAAPFGSASILTLSWMYIRMMGDQLSKATELAILNANYMAARLRPHYPILFVGKTGGVAHEFIIDLRPLKAATGISEEDVAKRLMDYNFHAPTMSFPVPGTLMVEPTESEPLCELDRFCDAMIQIRKEIQAVQDGKVDKKNNVLKNAPHTADVVLSDKWNRSYSRESAAYPLPYLRLKKFWPYVGRVDNVYGDRNLVCACPPTAEYAP